MRPFSIGICVGLLVLVGGMWMHDRGEKVAESADAYEQCVEAEYGMSPSAWYQQRGAYPVCK